MKAKGTMIAVLGAAMAVFTGCKEAAKDAGRAEVAGPTTIRDAVRLTGTIEPLDSVELKSEVSGKIVKILFREGDEVKRGQLILLIDTVPFLLSRDKSALQVDRAALALKTAQREVARAKELVVTGSVSKDHVEDLETAVQRAELDLRDAKLSLRNTELDLARTKIRAPMDGRLINFPSEVGEVAASAVGANGGTSLGTIADPTKLKVVVEVGELDYARLKLGMSVKVSTEGGRPRAGHVSFIPSSARASADTKTIKVFPVEVVLDGESEGILPGMTVGVDFVFLEREVPVSVAYEAVKTGGRFGGKASSSGGQVATDSVKLAPVDSARKGRDGGDTAKRARHADGKWQGSRDGAGTSGARSGGEGSVARPQAKTATVLVRGPEGKLAPKQVKIGVTDYRRTEIVEGLAVGDTVWIQDDGAASKSASGQKRGGPGGPP